MNYTPEQITMFAEYLFGKENIEGEINLDLSDWRIIKQLESKMISELHYDFITKETIFDKEGNETDVAYLGTNEGDDPNWSKTLAQGKDTLEAVFNHVNKEVRK